MQRALRAPSEGTPRKQSSVWLPLEQTGARMRDPRIVMSILSHRCYSYSVLQGITVEKRG